MRAVLAEDEALLYYYWVNREDLLVVAIGRRAFFAQIVSIDREKLDACSAEIFTAGNCDSVAFQTHLNELEMFAQRLLPPEIREVLQDKGRLIISPHRALHAIPFQALPWNEEGQHLIDRFSLTYVPNLTCLLTSYVPSARRNLLALGIDRFSINLDGCKVSDLEEAEAEVTDLQALYQSRGHAAKTCRGADANELGLHDLDERGALGGFTTLHFATHGVNVNSDTPMESFIILHDSSLDGLEIANWRLNAELVVLSACSSGQRAIAGRGMDELPGDDLFGLQAAFFATGAKCVLGSLWPVRTNVARTIMTAFHRFLLDGHAPDVALQKATLEYLRRAGPRTRQSRYWAPFFVSNVGRPVLPTQS